MNHRRSIVRRIGRELSRYQIKLFTKRSIVREIGSRLPLKPCKRPYFEVNICSKTDKLSLLNVPVITKLWKVPLLFTARSLTREIWKENKAPYCQKTAYLPRSQRCCSQSFYP